MALLREIVVYKGVTYYRYPESARRSDQLYFRARGKLLHRVIYEERYGPVDKGIDIHHVDGDTANNAIENLAAMSKVDHCRLTHLGKCSDKMRAHLDSIRHLATDWTRTEKGKRLLAVKGRKDWNARPVLTLECVQCGKSFVSKQSWAKFCSNNCKSAMRRKQAADAVVRHCVWCGTEFSVNKYSKQRFCGTTCAGKYRRSLRK